MGVDSKAVRYVLHYKTLWSMITYTQEIGRAGRDDNRAVAAILYNQNTLFTAAQALHYNVNDKEQLNDQLSEHYEMARVCEDTKSCRRFHIAKKFNPNSTFTNCRQMGGQLCDVCRNAAANIKYAEKEASQEECGHIFNAVKKYTNGEDQRITVKQLAKILKGYTNMKTLHEMGRLEISTSDAVYGSVCLNIIIIFHC